MRFPILALVLTLTACSPPQSEPDDHSGEDGTEETSHSLHLEPGQVRAWELTTGPVGRTDIVGEITLPGVLGPDENRTARIAPLVAGQIARIRTDLGRRVGTDQVLAELNAPEYTRAQTEFLMATTRAELSRKDYERARVLWESQAIEEREFLRRESLYEQELAELQAAEAILRAMGMGLERIGVLREQAGIPPTGQTGQAVEPLLPLVSPLPGVVLERDAILGDHVQPGRTLFVVSDLGVLWALLDAYEHQLDRLRPDAEVTVRTPLVPGRAFPGRITYIADQVDPELRTVRVRVEVPNRDGLLRPNLFIEGTLHLRDPGRSRMVVPEEAVQLLEGGHVVFVQDAADEGEDHIVFTAREVEVGETLSTGRIILSGLQGDETVVTRGAFDLKAELTRGAAGQQHVH